MPSLAQRAIAEWLGTAFLLAAVVGSGIMAQKLAGGNNLHPSRSGIMMSSVTAAGRNSRTSRNPSWPPRAVTTVNPERAETYLVEDARRHSSAPRAARQRPAETSMTDVPMVSSKSPNIKGAKAWAARAGAPSMPVRSPYA
jgi:hypothetical protein